MVLFFFKIRMKTSGWADCEECWASRDLPELLNNPQGHWLLPVATVGHKNVMLRRPGGGGWLRRDKSFLMAFLTILRAVIDKSYACHVGLAAAGAVRDVWSSVKGKIAWFHAQRASSLFPSFSSHFYIYFFFSFVLFLRTTELQWQVAVSENYRTREQESTQRSERREHGGLQNDSVWGV